MVDRGGLENRCARKRTVGSNPTLSAIYGLSAGMAEVFQDLNLAVRYLGTENWAVWRYLWQEQFVGLRGGEASFTSG